MIHFKYQLNDVESTALSSYGLTNVVIDGYLDNDLIHNVNRAKLYMIGRMIGDELSSTYYDPEAIIADSSNQAIRIYSEIHETRDASLMFQLRDNCIGLKVIA